MIKCLCQHADKPLTVKILTQDAGPNQSRGLIGFEALFTNPLKSPSLVISKVTSHRWSHKPMSFKRGAILQVMSPTRTSRSVGIQLPCPLFSISLFCTASFSLLIVFRVKLCIDTVNNLVRISFASMPYRISFVIASSNLHPCLPHVLALLHDACLA